MAATFPSGVKVFTTKQAGDQIASAHINDLQDEVVAVETELKKTTGSVVDHGGLTGLGDNDHPQYLLATGKAADSEKLDGIDSTGFVQTSGDQTVNGVKTFGSLPTLPTTTPTTNQPVRKGYADSTYLGISAKAADSDKLDGIDSTGFATASHNHDHGALTGLADNDHPQYVLVNNAKMQLLTALNDDTATSITPSNNQGFLLYRKLGGASGAVISFDATTGTAYCFKIAGSADIETRTGALSGTTGTDGKITISADTDGKVYVENRLGLTLYGGYCVL